MWYVIIIIVVVFQIVVSIFAPAFNLSTSGQLPEISANTTADLMAAGTNPLATFGDIMSFQLEGGEAFSWLFYLGYILIGLCFVRLIRGNN